jgi:glycerol-3-phosphate acyltransferase PlsX
MKIILDGMGGDHAPEEIVKGAVLAASDFEGKILIVGDEPRIRDILSTYEYDREKIDVIHAPEVIDNHDSPVHAIRRKRNSSMVVGLEMVKKGEEDMFISAGNSGAILTGGILVLGRIRGIDRPALGSTYPIMGQGMSMLIDSGANAECKPHNLLQFAIMGSLYMEKVIGVKHPSVGLINMGTEPGKGSKLLKDAYVLLERNKGEKHGLNFMGNVEARDVPFGISDVYVCDGLVGNVVLKMTEGMGLSVFGLIKRRLTDGMRAKLGAMVLMKKLNELRKDFDYSEYGGAPVLGVRGAVVKIHGAANALAVRNGILKAVPYVKNKVVETIEKSVENLVGLQVDEA